MNIGAEFGLNPRQEAFVIGVFAGKPAVKAYSEAYHKSPGAVDSKPYQAAKACAARLLTNANVQAALDHLRQGSASDAIASHQKRLEILTEIMENGESEGDRIRAIHEANLIDGGHSAARPEAEISNGLTLMEILCAAQQTTLS